MKLMGQTVRVEVVGAHTTDLPAIEASPQRREPVRAGRLRQATGVKPGEVRTRRGTSRDAGVCRHQRGRPSRSRSTIGGKSCLGRGHRAVGQGGRVPALPPREAQLLRRGRAPPRRRLLLPPVRWPGTHTPPHAPQLSTATLDRRRIG
jgi:hypothetical protein